MGRIVDILIRDLQDLLSSLGKNGGAIGPSVYDTAMVGRLAPPREGPDPALDWLLTQQHPDGGWCAPRYPIGRDLPTLAAVLALRDRRTDPRSREACAAGLAFLRKQSSQWTTIPDDLPIALELTLPALLAEAVRLGVDISPDPYRLLASVGEEKRRYLTPVPLTPGTPLAYAWEGLGLPPSPDLVDAAGSVGTSPAATARWLSTARDLRPGNAACNAAAAYLEHAARATGCGVPAVVPHAFPIPRFEQSWALFAVLSAGLFQRPEIAGSLATALDDLALAVRPDGVGYADVFVADGDDTFCSVAALKGGGRAVDVKLIRGFEGEEHFFVFPGERNPSPSANAHALYALALFGEDSIAARRFLVSRQHADGRFLEDKWHTSWLYTTHRAVLALRFPEEDDALRCARGALLSNQRADGGFGVEPASTVFETSHGLLALRAILHKGVGSGEDRDRMVRAYRFLLSRYRPFGPGEEPLWIGKEIYAVPRIDRAFELSAMLSVALELGE